jgi:hypothetical protein
MNTLRTMPKPIAWLILAASAALMIYGLIH